MQGLQKALCFLLLGILVKHVNAVTISSCPAYGCRPSGTFSYLIKLPSSNPKVIWNTTYESIANCLGCVGNINNIICPYKGPKSDGYVAIDGVSGNQSWYATVLHKPSLPVMDIDGDIIGTDGHNMAKYLADGTQVKPTKPVSPFLYPLFSVQLSDNGMLVFASMSGIIFSMDTAGIPLASISLDGTVERVNGTFIPVTTPIIVGNRIYILTEFRPEEDTPETRQPHILGMRRLYAVDIYLRMVDRLHTTWTFNFEREAIQKAAQDDKDNTLRFKPRHAVQGDPLIMANVQENVIHVILPPPEGDSNMPRTFWAIKDLGDNAGLLYNKPISASRMSMYEINGLSNINYFQPFGKKSRNSFKLFDVQPKTANKMSLAKTNTVWLLSDSKNIIYRVNSTNGSIEATFSLASVLPGQLEVTSDIMVHRSDDDMKDSVIFGVTAMTSESKNYVASMDYNGKIEWLVPTPSNVAVVGQIAGISAEGFNSDDMLVAFGNKDGIASVFAIQ